MKRLYLISLFVAIIFSGLFIVKTSINNSMEYSVIEPSAEYQHPYIAKELGGFDKNNLVENYIDMPQNNASKTTLKKYNKRRAFHGAPPYIPHNVDSERAMGQNKCLQCHEKGGFVYKWNAYTPIVPHPEKVNCRQCHVVQKNNSNFKDTNWKKREADNYYVNALLGSPPVIPHQIQMHENCLSCHAGVSAPLEIRVSHPERTNCRQCHVENNQEVKKNKQLTSFYRNVK